MRRDATYHKGKLLNSNGTDSRILSASVPGCDYEWRVASERRAVWIALSDFKALVDRLGEEHARATPNDSPTLTDSLTSCAEVSSPQCDSLASPTSQVENSNGTKTKIPKLPQSKLGTKLAELFTKTADAVSAFSKASQLDSKRNSCFRFCLRD